MTPTVEAAPTPAPAGTPSADAAERLRYAKDVIAGRIIPAPTPTPPWLEESLKRIAARHGRPAPRWMRAEYLLRKSYGGRTVVTFQPADPGEIVVLAAGMSEIGELVRGLDGDEKERILVRNVDPPTEDGPTPAGNG